MADFLIGNVRQVREIAWEDTVNLHLADGWVLLLVRAGQESERNFETGAVETVATTVYVIGWTNDDEPKSIKFYKDELCEALTGEADVFP